MLGRASNPDKTCVMSCSLNNNIVNADLSELIRNGQKIEQKDRRRRCSSALVDPALYNRHQEEVAGHTPNYAMT